MHWLAYANGGSFPVGERWHEVVRELGAKVSMSPPTRTTADVVDDFSRCLSQVIEHAQAQLDDALPFLERRGVDRATAERWGFGFIGSKAALVDEIPAGRRIFGEGLLTERPRSDGTSIWDRRVVCPWRDSRGRVVALWGRSVDEVDVDTDAPKYLVSGRRPLLFGHDRALPSARREGLVLAAGVGRCTVVFDGDAGGRAGLEQLVRTLRSSEGSLDVDVVDPGVVDADPDELVRSGGWPAVLSEARSWLTWWASTLLAGVSPSSPETARLRAAKACAAWAAAVAPRYPIEAGEVARMVEAATGIRAAYVHDAYELVD